MLGSHFDLKKEVARIAAKRDATPAPEIRVPEKAFIDFDDKIRDFVRSLGISESSGGRSADINVDQGWLKSLTQIR